MVTRPAIVVADRRAIVVFMVPLQMEVVPQLFPVPGQYETGKHPSIPVTNWATPLFLTRKGLRLTYASCLCKQILLSFSVHEHQTQVARSAENVSLVINSVQLVL